MNQNPNQPQSSEVWGAPQAAPEKKWSVRKTAAAVGVGVAIAAGGGAAIYAASGNSGTNSGPGGMGGPGMSAMDGQNGNAQDGGMGGPMSALHGEFVVSNGNGGYTTEVTQTGTVTAVSATSITAKSTDQFTRTYTIAQHSSGTSVQVGDTATIRGTLSGDTATATTISEGSDQEGPGGGPAGPPDR